MRSQLGLYNSRPYRPPAVVSKVGLEPGGVRRGNPIQGVVIQCSENYFGIGATLGTRQEIQCLPYAFFLLLYLDYKAGWWDICNFSGQEQNDSVQYIKLNFKHFSEDLNGLNFPPTINI